MRPAVFHILVALAECDLHGLGIAEAVDRNTEGALDLGPGTLYRSLAEMTEEGLIVPVNLPGAVTDPRRKYYRITVPGRQALRAEAARLGRLVELLRTRHVLPEGL